MPVPIWWFRRLPTQFAYLSDLGVVRAAVAYDAELGVRIDVGDAAEGMIL